MPRKSGASKIRLCPAISKASLWEQRGGCGLDPNRGECAITVWRYILQALKEFRWSPTSKQVFKHYDFELLPTYDDVMHGTALVCVAHMLVT